jgi:hypothetical protein
MTPIDPTLLFAQVHNIGAYRLTCTVRTIDGSARPRGARAEIRISGGDPSLQGVYEGVYGGSVRECRDWLDATVQTVRGIRDARVCRMTHEATLTARAT